MNFLKKFGDSRYPGALSPVLENIRPSFSPDPTDCPWVSEDGITFTSNVKRKFVPRDHVSPLLVAYCSLFLHIN